MQAAERQDLVTEARRTANQVARRSIDTMTTVFSQFESIWLLNSVITLRCYFRGGRFIGGSVS